MAGTAGRVGGGGGGGGGGADVRAGVVAALLRSGAGLDDVGRSTAANFNASIGSTGSPTASGFVIAATVAITVWGATAGSGGIGAVEASAGVRRTVFAGFACSNTTARSRPLSPLRSTR